MHENEICATARWHMHINFQRVSAGHQSIFGLALARADWVQP
jgi:hypothetical protein